MAVTDWSAWTLPDPPAAAWPAYLPDHLSASQLGMLERCPRQYQFRYVQGAKEPPSTALVWGTADGKAHGVNFTQKIQSHEDMTTSEMREVFATVLDAEVEERGGAGEIVWGDDKPAEIQKRGIELVACYHEQVSPRVQPTGVEEKLTLEIPGVPVPYIGYVDVDTAGYVIERKTASQQSKTIPPQYRFQTLGYALARSLPVELHIATRTIKPAVYTPAESPGLALAFDERLAARAEKMIAARARLLVSLCETFGPEEPWPDALGSQAWHMAICDMCGFGPNGNQACEWHR